MSHSRFGAFEERALAAVCVIDDLVRHDQRARFEIGAYAADRGDREHAFDLQLAQGHTQPAHDFAPLPDEFEGPPDKTADVLLDFFSNGQPGIPGIGGSIEPIADDDGVLIDETRAPEPAALT